MFERISIAFLRFYAHNDPIIFLIPLIIGTFIFLIVKPNRRKVLFLLGVIFLAVQFEYNKRIVGEIQSDWINQIFTEDFQFRKYQFTTFIIQSVFPFLLSLSGWVLIALSALL